MFQFVIGNEIASKFEAWRPVLEDLGGGRVKVCWRKVCKCKCVCVCVCVVLCGSVWFCVRVWVGACVRVGHAY